MFRIAEAKDYGNSGVEGISWYKDNTLLVGTQTGANLWCCQLDGTVLWKRSMRTVAIGQLEIADIHYDPVKDQIWIIDSETQSIYLFNGDATTHLATYKVSFGGNCESVHVDYGNNCVWIADDSEPSKLFKIEMDF
jgi:outer membrane protein assembly factor BamB